MSYDEADEWWARAAAEELQRYRARPVSVVLDEIRAGSYGDHFQIWKALERRTTIEAAGWLLFGVLTSNADYLVRFHCAAALLSLFNPYPDVLEPAKLSGREGYYVDQHLAEYRAELVKRIGEEPARS